MNSQSEIEHTGVVHNIGEDSITVRITAHPSCSSCHASGLCNSAETVDKFFELPIQENIFHGQDVRIITSLSNGFRALYLGYIIPLFILLLILIVSLASGVGEVMAGIMSVAAVALYYFLIYMVRHKIENKIKFTLKPA